jgi:DNA polymerase-1
MIVNADAKSLEINVAAYLSQDPILLDEVRSGFDMHAANQKMLGLPSRLIAKVFVFRLIYGGSAYAYSVDSDFAECGFSAKKWQQIIDTFYDKYKGLAQWHNHLMRTVIKDGFLKMPTGREYHYQPKQDYKGEIKWPRTTILNYPVQGLGADIMAIARVIFAKKFRDAKINGVLINTVHDSIECDVVDMNEVKRTSKLFFETFQEIPATFKAIFGVEYNLPLFCEVSYGHNRKDLEEILLTDC